MIGRIAISDVQPVVECGRYPARAVVGETFTISATVFREGHEAVGANVVLRAPDGRKAPFTRMVPGSAGTDRWHAEVSVDTEGQWTYVVEAWGDPFGSWRHAVGVKSAVGQDVSLELEEGARLLERALRGLPSGRRAPVETAITHLRDTGLDPAGRLSPSLDAGVAAVLSAHPVRELLTRSERRTVWVDRPRALFGSWYEFFPRSAGATVDPPRSGTFRTAIGRLPAIAEMGFDVVYLPPIHPIGTGFRKGPNNTLTPGPDDPGSPWAIGSEAGGHDAVHPDLGTIADFDAFVARAGDLGLEIALDLALQCSPDHPWTKDHREWFTVRADGTIAYAENPPKKYQDIYPLNFDKDPDGIYAEVLRIVRHWIDHGVRIFRVDNPHTKPLNFWEWLLAEVRKTDPDVLFLAEAFTRPAMMHMLARIGFQQSYTYFTWRNTKAELQDYLTELAGEAADYMRPNFFVNTQDILHAFLQYGGPPAFKIRAVLAALLVPTWGVYSGYELFEATALRAGSEEYLDSEKYQYRPRDWSVPESQTLIPYIRGLNMLRRDHPALHWLRNLRFHDVDSPTMLAFSKRQPAAAGGTSEDVVLVVVNLDPHAVQEATVHLDLPALGFDWEDRFRAHDELTGKSYDWGRSNYVRLDPFVEPAHIFTVQPRGTSAATT